MDSLSSIISVNSAVSSQGRCHFAVQAEGDKRLQCKEKGRHFSFVKISKAQTTVHSTGQKGWFVNELLIIPHLDIVELNYGLPLSQTDG